MARSTSPDAPTPGQTPQAEPGSRRVIDRRLPERYWIPVYVYQDFGPRLGAYGLSVYLSLAFHTTRHALKRWPSLAEIAVEVGCSRSTVERVMRQLRDLELIQTEPCIDDKGQHSNFIYLIDPPSIRALDLAPRADEGGAVPLTAPPRPTDGAPPSSGRGGAVPQTAPSLDPKDPKEGEGGAPSAPAPPPALRSQLEQISALQDLWEQLLLCHVPAFRALQHAEVGVEVAELLRRGYSFEQLQASLLEADRDRAEYPRVWRARMAKRVPAAKRSPVIDQARRAAEARRQALADAKDLEESLGGATLYEALKGRNHQRGQQP